MLEVDPKTTKRDIEYWLGSFVIFQGIWTSIAKKAYSFVIIQGSPPFWIRAWQNIDGNILHFLELLTLYMALHECWYFIQFI